MSIFTKLAKTVLNSSKYEFDWLDFTTNPPKEKDVYLCVNMDTKYTQMLLWCPDEERWEDMDGYSIIGVTHYTTIRLPEEST